MTKLPQYPGLSNYSKGKNYGFFWHDGAVFMQTWTARKMALPEKDATTSRYIDGVVSLHFGIINEGDILRAPSYLKNHKFHNNGIDPIFIKELNLLLVMGHSLVKDSKRFLPRFHTNYLQYFLLLDPTPPFTMRHMSPPFCVPVQWKPTVCECIQFSMSTLLLPATNELLMFYGINDCEAAVVRISVANMLAFTLGNVTQLILQ
jgi:hypothetical protein